MRTSFVLILSVIWSCQTTPKLDFYSWLTNHEKSSNKEMVEESGIETFYSKDFTIDTIYRSMQGPYEIKHIQLGEKSEDILWITAYESEVISTDTEVKVSDGYMCHSNLNFADTSTVPWRLNAAVNNSRIFTLSEGQTKLEMPKGFGIPVPSGQKFELVSQVLNHHNNEINLEVKHKAKIKYQKNSNTLKALYQKSIFITKQYAGPEGKYGTPKQCADFHEHEEVVNKSNEHDCGVHNFKGKYDPYKDNYGRMYTGHWEIPYGPDTLKTNVSRMMELRKETKIHLIGVHLHPFAEALEFWDISDKKLLYSASMDKDSLDFSFKSIHYYTSDEGISVFPDHQYELKSVYNSTDSSNMHSAMAVMYLYFAE